MKLFTQVALVTAIAASGSTFAMQSMDDAALGVTTGQDGLTITIAPPAGGISINQIAIFDRDGISGTEAGAILIGKYSTAGNLDTGTAFNISGGSIGLVIDASGGGASGVVTGSAPVLNVKVVLPTSLTIQTGDISVGGAQGAAGAQTVDTSKNAKILSSMTIALSGATLNIQLGNPNQGAMMVLGGSIGNGGLQIGTGVTGVGGIYLTDGAPVSANQGNIGIQKLTVLNSGNTVGAVASSMTLSANVDVYSTVGFNSVFGTSGTAGGLGVTLGAGSNYDIYMQGVTLGGSAAGAQIAGESIGDVKLTGLNLVGAKIGIQGH